MVSHLEISSFKLYFHLDEEFCTFLENQGLSYASSRQLAKLAVGMLRSLKKSVSSAGRLYFPEFLVKDVLKHLNKLLKSFRDINRSIFERIRKTWDNRERAFIICDDFLIPRYTKKAFRSGTFRDPVKKKLLSVITLSILLLQ